MHPLAIMAIGAALGAAKSKFVDQPAADKQRRFEAEKARYSGWTGMQPNHVQDPNMMSGALQGGVGGLLLGANLKQAGMLGGEEAAGAAADMSAPAGNPAYTPGQGQGMYATSAQPYGQTQNPWDWRSSYMMANR